ncbi:hypothetical protein BDW_10770 [Bdellovibrio bacteriovorus W]|nr:hypothetical protein BDW_10770 [Bdellovibrio bacteriovorus W]
MDPQDNIQRPESTEPRKRYRSNEGMSVEYRGGQTTKTYLPVQKNYSQETCVVVGALMVVLGLVGFVVQDLFGAHFTYAHNIIHIVAGGLAMWFGFDSVANSRRYAYIAGAIFGVLGVLGFILGTVGIPSVPSLAEDTYLWRLIPGTLEFGVSDHILHCIYGVAFLIGASLTFKNYKKV